MSSPGSKQRLQLHKALRSQCFFTQRLNNLIKFLIILEVEAAQLTVFPKTLFFSIDQVDTQAEENPRFQKISLFKSH